MKHRKLMALLIAVTAAICACNSTPPTTPSGPPATPSVAAAVPARNAENPCWVHIWEDENFEDNNDRIFGPGRWNNMRNLPGANKSDWGDEIDSLKVGPAATVTVWEDENFGDNSQTYGPGTEKTNLRGNPDMGDQIDSMEIKCR
jgi:hypothetical protein